MGFLKLIMLLLRVSLSPKVGQKSDTLFSQPDDKNHGGGFVFIDIQSAMSKPWVEQVLVLSRSKISNN